MKSWSVLEARHDAPELLEARNEALEALEARNGAMKPLTARNGTLEARERPKWIIFLPLNRVPK